MLINTIILRESLACASLNIQRQHWKVCATGNSERNSQQSWTPYHTKFTVLFLFPKWKQNIMTGHHLMTGQNIFREIHHRHSNKKCSIGNFLWIDPKHFFLVSKRGENVFIWKCAKQWTERARKQLYKTTDRVMGTK